MKKNIIIDCKNFPQYSSGIKGYFKPFLKETIEHFSEFNFILTTFSDFDTSFLTNIPNWEIKIIKKINFNNNFLNIVYYDLWTYPNALKKLNAILLISPYYDFLIPKFYKNKSIITIHDMCYWEVAECYSFRVKLYHKFLLNLNIYKAIKIITVSNTSLNSIKKYFKKRIFEKCIIIYNIFEFKNENIQSLKHDTDTKSLLYTGGYEQRKNVTTLLYVLRELKNEMNIILYFTGNASDNKHLRDQVQSLNLDNVVNFTGVISNKQLENLYKQCNTVINLSLCEGFGRSNLEAVLYHKPLVCSNIEVFKELVAEYPFYCDPLSVESIKKAIKSSFDCKTNMSRNINIEKLSYDININNYIKVIHNLLYDK